MAPSPPRKGDSFSGVIRWDRCDDFWNDEFNATKTERIKKDDSGPRFSLFGIKIGPGEDYIRHSLTIPFGHLSRIKPIEGGAAMLTLKNGETIRAEGGTSSDMGRGLRRLTIQDSEAGLVEVAWSSIDEVVFRSDPGPGTDDERLFGTVKTATASFTGFLVWDRDEAMLEDIIDGEDETGVDRKIPLREIRVVEPRARGGSTLTLAEDKTVILTGTNDIDDGHRGIRIVIEGVGAVDVDWDDVRRVEFAQAPPSPAYETFLGGQKLSGTVHTNSGATHKGVIVWDRDESYTWETIDDELDNFDYSILFSNVASVERNGSRGARVTLRSGDVLVLTGSNDVDSSHKGVVVRKATDPAVELEWMDVARIEFD